MTKPVPQRILLERLKRQIDLASAKGAGASRDQAKAELRELLRTENWQTVFIRYNLAVRRCRYLRSIGYPMPMRFLYTDEDDIERINAYKERER